MQNLHTATVNAAWPAWSKTIDHGQRPCILCGMLNGDDLLARSHRVSSESAELAAERRKLSGHLARLTAQSDRLGTELVRAVPLATLANWLQQGEPLSVKGRLR